MNHGGDLGEIERRFPRAPRPFIDLSTGINPWPWPVGTLPETVWRRLPEPEAERRLREAAASAYGVRSADCVVAGPGTQALIQWLPRLRPGPKPARVLVLAPTYSEHAHAWRAAGHDVEDVLRLDTLIESAEAAVVVNPNNPDGRVVAAPRLLDWAAALARRGGWLIVDEAFVDAEPCLSIAAEVEQRRGLIVLRSFGKFYGLAGLRLGFALAEPELAEALRGALGPWAVSGAALAIGAAALADAAWAERTRERLAGAAAELDRALAARGLRPIGGTSLYRLVETPRARAVFDELAKRGILVRRFEERETWLRFGLPPDDEAMARLTDALDAGL
jgi:cobalamin biosynthetic protein CobC